MSDTLAAAYIRASSGASPQTHLSNETVEEIQKRRVDAIARRQEAADKLSGHPSYMRDVMTTPLDVFSDNSPIYTGGDSRRSSPSITDAINDTLGPSPVLRAVASARALVDMRPEEASKYLEAMTRAEDAKADDAIALLKRNQKIKDAVLSVEEQRHKKCTSALRIEVEHLESVATTQSNLAENDAEYADLMRSRLLAQERVLFFEAQNELHSQERRAESLKNELERFKLDQKYQRARTIKTHEDAKKEVIRFNLGKRIHEGGERMREINRKRQRHAEMTASAENLNRSIELDLEEHKLLDEAWDHDDVMEDKDKEGGDVLFSDAEGGAFSDAEE